MSGRKLRQLSWPGMRRAWRLPWLMLSSLPAWAGAHAAIAIDAGPVAAAAGQKQPASRRAAVSHIDFRRGHDGEGLVLVGLSGDDERIELGHAGDAWWLAIDQASLPLSLARHLDVADFATPVKSIRAGTSGHGVRIGIEMKEAAQAIGYRRGSEYVVEVTAKRAAVPAAVAADKLAAEVASDRHGKPVSFNFQDIPVRSALQLLADISGLNLVAADSVAGRITLRLVNVPWDQALAVILRAKGLDQRRTGNVVWIAPQDELIKYEQAVADTRLKNEDNAELVTAYLPISYGHAADIAKLLTEGARRGRAGTTATATGAEGGARGFLSSRGSVSYDERTNTLLIIDSAQKLLELRALVAQLDRPVQQVLIESRIVIATDNFTRELGAKFGLGARRRGSGTTSSIGGGLIQDATTGAVTGTGGLNVNLPPADGAASSFAVAILGRNYALDLELLASQSEGHSETISSPRAVVANNQEADIKEGQQIGYVTYQNSATGTAGSGTATVAFKDAVLELKVTPTITADHRVFLKIAMTKDALDHYEAVPNSGRVPVINTRSMNTSVLVDDGQTAVLGGIYEASSVTTTSKVPGLGDLPLLGALFRSKGHEKDKAELLIFVTPRILPDAPR